MRGSCGSDVFKKRLVERTLDENLQQQRLLPVWAKEGSFRILIHNERTSEMRITLGELTVRTAIMAVLLIGLPGVCHAQAPDPASLVLVTSPPPHGNFWSLQGNYPPFPCDPFPQLPLFSDGTPGTYYYDASGFDFQSLRQMQMESAPTPPGLPSVGTNYSGSSGGGGGGSGGWQQASFTLNGPLDYAAYTNLWLSISNEGTTSYVTLESTLSNLTYLVFTNGDLANPSGWGLYTNLLAMTNATPVPPLNAGTNSIFFSAAMVWNTCDNPSALPDWESMLYFNTLCATTNVSYITNGLVAYWKLNDGTGTTAADSSGNDNTLPLLGSPSWGFAWLPLDGSTQYGDGGPNMLANLDNADMTICAWIDTTTNSTQGIVDKDYYNVCGDYGGWSFFVEAGQLHFSLEYCYGDTPPDSGPASVPLGQWTFVAVTWHYPGNSGNQVCYYINGILNSAQGDGGARENPSGAAHLLVGKSRAINPLEGSMHDVGIYNRALSSNEIASNYLSSDFTPTVSVPDLLYYKMTEGSANTNTPQTLADSSSAGDATGTILGPYVFWTNGITGSTDAAMHFNGGTPGNPTPTGNYIATTKTNPFNFTTNSFTINVWLLPYTPGGYLLGNNSVTNSGWFLSFGGDQLQFGADTSNAENTIQTATIGLWPGPNDPYAMVTITRDGTNTPLIYLNAKPQATEGSFTNPAESVKSLTFGIGTNVNGLLQYDGNMWQPQIWSKALTPGDVANLYFNQLSGIPWP
jgi:hypothetical protein